MALVDLVYRCPFCGTDTHWGEPDAAHCPECGRVFEPGGRGFDIRITQGDGSSTRVELGALIDRMSAANGDEGGLESLAIARFAFREHPVRYRGSLIGFFEERGPNRPGTLRLDDEALRFDEATGERHAWHLLDLRAVQTASASVQVSPLGQGLASFKILDQSPRRWEDALKARLSEAWRTAGRGEILEFQPRIRTR